MGPTLETYRPAIWEPEMQQKEKIRESLPQQGGREELTLCFSTLAPWHTRPRNPYPTVNR